MSRPDAESLDELAADYRRSLPAKLARLVALRDAASSDAAALRELHRELHKIAGAAKMFGVGEVGEAARVVAETLEPHLAAARLPDEAGWRRLDPLLAAVQSAGRAAPAR